jgi:cyclic beta-1,2-glucan synthetase
VGEQPGGVFVRRRDQLGPVFLEMIRAAARVVLTCDGRTLGMIAEEWRDSTELDEQAPAPPPPIRARDSGQRLTDPFSEVHRVYKQRPRPITPARSPLVPAPDSGSGQNGESPATGTALLFDNGIGGLTEENDYLMRVRGDHLPPAPWANVIANAQGGCIITERGAGCTWAGNAQFYRLTPWRNDPVGDEASDALYLRDEENGELWSPTPGPVRNDDHYTVRHSAGSSRFEHARGGIRSDLTIGMAPDDPVRIAILTVTNDGTLARRLSLTWYVEWTVGVVREESKDRVVARFDDTNQVMSAANTFNPAFGHVRAFAALSEPLTSFTGDRHEFLGRNGSLADPAALRERHPLSGTVLAGIDPCAALQCDVTLEPGGSRQIVALLGAAPSDDETLVMAEAYRSVPRAQAALDRSGNEWSRRLSTITVRTPSPAFDAMINRWALYQSISCRLWGRAAVYQSSGAFGFRDQLQDVMACLHAEPTLAREHILRAASRQFVEGDVQHWWHPPDGQGVRTRISDDLVWLPFVVEHYVRVTGDTTILDEPTAFISMPALGADQHERYDLPQPTDRLASVYEHCLLALRHAATEGPRGLPLIGSGDWNDGMNRVGIGGVGESVWLGWFLITTLRSFANLVSGRNDDQAASELRERADRYAAAIEQHGWDGEWYRRAYFDDGTPLGSSSSDECRIDSIAQSWSVLSGAGNPDRQRVAMQSLEAHLVREDARLIALLTPPFDETPVDPGYIRGYVPGVRENGAQYTHAAVWAVQATALLGNVDRAFELFQMINPLMHSRDAAEVETYKVEPYAVAADIYTAAGHVGRGGWTWYTGSASWLYRAGLETILGFTRTGNTLRLTPRVPNAWNEYQVEYRYGSSVYAITVRRVTESIAAKVTVDGVPQPGADISLLDDGARHEVLVEMAFGAELSQIRH